MQKTIKILKKDFVTHDVLRFVLERPQRLKFVPGQAAHLSINKSSWKNKIRPFTFTCLQKDLVLEFVIKIYPEHEGVTKKIAELEPGESFILHDVFGTINYQGKGIFIAGGAGITPFIAILRDLKKNNKIKGNKVIFSNKKQEDIILEKELRDMFRKNPQDLIFTLTEEKKQGYENKLIDKKFIKKHIKGFKQNFYICGPPKMNESLTEILGKLGARVNSIVFEGRK